MGNATSTVTPRTFYESERCALVWGYTAETRDCDSKMSCGVCYLKTRTRLMMKGLCKDDTSTDLGPNSIKSQKLSRKVSRNYCNKMVNSSNGPAAKLLAWSSDSILLKVTEN